MPALPPLPSLGLRAHSEMPRALTPLPSLQSQVGPAMFAQPTQVLVELEKKLSEKCVPTAVDATDFDAIGAAKS